MISRALAAVMVVGACGGQADKPADTTDAGLPGGDPRPVLDAPPDSSVIYTATLDTTAAVPFGTTTPAPDNCSYTITLKQLSMELGITPLGRISRGHVEATNLEQITSADCNFTPIPENVATYTFMSSKPSAGGLTLFFAGDPGNGPTAQLIVELTALDSGAPQAALSFQRTGIVAPFNWVVPASLALAPPAPPAGP